MDTAIDTGCLRCRFDTGFTSGLFSSLVRKRHSCQRPLAIAWIARGVDAQVTNVSPLRIRDSRVELALSGAAFRRRQRQSREQGSRARIAMDLELTGRSGLWAYD